MQWGALRSHDMTSRETPLQPLKKCCQCPSRSLSAGMANHLHRIRDGDTGRYCVVFLCASCCIFYLVGALKPTSLGLC